MSSDRLNLTWPLSAFNLFEILLDLLYLETHSFLFPCHLLLGSHQLFWDSLYHKFGDLFFWIRFSHVNLISYGRLMITYFFGHAHGSYANFYFINYYNLNDILYLLLTFSRGYNDKKRFVWKNQKHLQQLKWLGLPLL